MAEGTIYLPLGQGSLLQPNDDEPNMIDVTSPDAPSPIDLTNFALLIELQPVATIVSILDLIGNECYRRELFAPGNEIKQIVSELRA